MKLKELRALLALPVLLTRSGDSALRRLCPHDCRNRTTPCRCNRTKPRRRRSDGMDGSDRSDGSSAERTERTACASRSEAERENSARLIKRQLYPFVCQRPGNSVRSSVPTEAPAEADLRSKFRYCCGGSAVRASSIAFAFGRSWGWIQNYLRRRRRRAQRDGWTHSGENRWHMRVYNRDKKTE